MLFRSTIIDTVVPETMLLDAENFTIKVLKKQVHKKVGPPHLLLELLPFDFTKYEVILMYGMIMERLEKKQVIIEQN